MYGNSRPVTSNQCDSDARLWHALQRNQVHEYRQPLAATQQRLFDRIHAYRQQHPGPVILDSGCGNGLSTLRLAQKHPQALIIGLDKSAHRLRRFPLTDNFYCLDNIILARTDVVGFWRMARRAGWELQRHCLLYPNPWPKQKHLSRRWYAHPAFQDLLALGGILEVRSNWPLYLREFCYALRAHGQRVRLSRLVPATDPVSPFERKYHASGHDLYKLLCPLHPAGCQ